MTSLSSTIKIRFWVSTCPGLNAPCSEMDCTITPGNYELAIQIYTANNVEPSGYTIRYGRSTSKPCFFTGGKSRGFAGLLVFIRTKPRSRHIPASVRRKKEAEFVLKTGKKFDR